MVQKFEVPSIRTKVSTYVCTYVCVYVCVYVGTLATIPGTYFTYHVTLSVLAFLVRLDQVPIKINTLFDIYEYP